MRLAGHGPNGEPILSGPDVFRLMDTHGIPFDVIQDLLADRGWGFCVPGFIRAALDSGNFTRPRLLRVMTADLLPSQRGLAERVREALAIVEREGLAKINAGVRQKEAGE